MAETTEMIYLDNAATSWPKPESVYRFMNDFYRSTGANPGRSGYDMAIEAGVLQDQLRKRLTHFFGGDDDTPERLCFGYNATDALNLILFGLLSRGDHVVTTNLEHNSVIRPINHLVRDSGVEATFVPFNSRGVVNPGDISAAIRPNTRLVITTHASNVLGTIQAVAEIGTICREHGIPYALDATATAGIIPIDMKRMNVDVLAFSGHKSLMGSTGIGGMCIRKHLEIRQSRAGGTGVHSAYPYHLEEYPWRMEFGTPNLVGIASLWAGLDWIEQQGIENIHARKMHLTRRLVEGIRQIQGTCLYCCDSLENHIPTFIMNIEGMEAAEVSERLDIKHNIATRSGLHCAPLVHQQLGTVQIHGGVRFSAGAFNTEEQIEQTIEAVAEVATWGATRNNKKAGC
jgi:cysteine desulfurase / selenocysteine lyase